MVDSGNEITPATPKLAPSGSDLPKTQSDLALRVGPTDPALAVADGISQIKTALSTFQQKVNTIGTLNDAEIIRENICETRLHIGKLVKDTLAKLKQAREIYHSIELLLASQKNADYKLGKDFQAVLKEFQEAQKLANEKEGPFAPNRFFSGVDWLGLSKEDQSQTMVARHKEARRFATAFDERRQQGVKEVEQQIVQANQIFEDLGVLVHELGTKTDIGSKTQWSTSFTGDASTSATPKLAPSGSVLPKMQPDPALHVDGSGPTDPALVVAYGISQIKTAVSTFQGLVNTIGTPKDAESIRENICETRLRIGKLAKDTSVKFKQACEIYHSIEVMLASRKNSGCELAKGFQAVVKEFQEAQRLADERERFFAPNRFFLQADYLGENSEDVFLEQVALHEESTRFAISFDERRQQGIQEVEQQIVQANQIFKDLGVLVHELGTKTGIDSKTQWSNSFPGYLPLVMLGIVPVAVGILFAARRGRDDLTRI